MASTPIKITSVIEICRSLEEAGRASEFAREMEDSGAFVSVDENTLKLVQEYFAKNRLDLNPFGDSVTRIRGCPDYTCPHVYKRA